MEQIRYEDQPPHQPQSPRRKRRRKKPPVFGLVLICLSVAVIAALAVWGSANPPYAQPAQASESEGLGALHTEAPPTSAVALPTATPAPTTQPTPVPTPTGPGPLNQQAIAQLDDFLSAQPGSVSVWLQDIESGQVYTYNQRAGFYCASTLKAPYALWLAQQDEAGLLDLEQMVGTDTAWQRVHSMIFKSSNGAAHDLAETWPGNEETGFAAFLQQLGFASPGGCKMLEEGIQGWMTAADGGKAMRALYDYFETATPNALQLQKGFLEADHQGLWSPAAAGRKYGSWEKAFHDMAIVYADRPYVLSVFTDWGSQEVGFPPEAVEMMDQLGRLVAECMGAV